MADHFEDLLVYSGEKYSVFFHAEGKGVSRVYDHYRLCDDVTRASLLYLVKRMADAGHIYDETKFRVEDKPNKIYCFKPRSERFFCFFFAGKKIIITSGYTKKKQKVDRHELARAVKVREQYL